MAQFPRECGTCKETGKTQVGKVPCVPTMYGSKQAEALVNQTTGNHGGLKRRVTGLVLRVTLQQARGVAAEATAV